MIDLKEEENNQSAIINNSFIDKMLEILKDLNSKDINLLNEHLDDSESSNNNINSVDIQIFYLF